MAKKSFVQQYISYIRDNPHGYWFKRKPFGWGWVPATREGWVITILFAALIVWDAFSFSSKSLVTISDMWVYLGSIVFLVFLLVVICFATGEKPRWSWGFT